MSENKRETMAKLLENTRKQLADDPNAYSPVILPVIRQAMGKLIAEDILGVQPMFSPYSKEEWPYQADILGKVKYKDIDNVKDWCKETLNEGEWAATIQFFAFKTEEAYAWFMLKWS